MSNVLNNVQQSIQILDDIQSSITSKGVPVSDNVPTSQYGDKVREIDEWRPDPDWWDIEPIYKNDTDNRIKAILLLNNATDSFTIPTTSIVQYRTSDDPNTIKNNTGTITFSGIGDKATADGYKTRWIIVYMQVLLNHLNYFKTTLYIYSDQVITDGRFCGDFRVLQKIKVPDSAFLMHDETCYYSLSLKQKIFNVVTKDIAMFNSCFRENSCVELINLDKNCMCNNLDYAFRAAYSLKEITKIINISECKRTDAAFYSCVSLKEVRLYGLKVSLNLATCYSLSRESLLYLLLNAQDVSADQQTLTLGATNLVKLSDDEKAIATTKGWILA